MKKKEVKINFFYIPAILLILLFVVRPFCETIFISLTKWNGYSSDKVFIGIKNYVDMLKDDRLKRAFVNTLIYGFASTFMQNVIGLLIAVFVDSRFRGNNIIRAVVYMPIMISGLIMGYIMYFFLTYDNGVLNDMIGIFGYEPVDWLADGRRGILFITLINTWQYAGNCMIIYLSGIQSIPQMYEEAAVIDGAGTFQRFRFITLPLLLPAVTTAVITNLIGGLKLFDGIIALTNGGPNYATHSMMSYLNSQYFLAEKAGYASAVGISTFVLIMVISLLCNQYFEGKSIEE